MSPEDEDDMDFYENGELTGAGLLGRLAALLITILLSVHILLWLWSILRFAFPH